MLSKGCDFSGKVSQNQACLLGTSQLGLMQTAASVSNHCWKFWRNGCIQNTAEQCHGIPSVLLDEYLFYLTTGFFQTKNGFSTFPKQNSGSERWLWMEAQRGWCCLGFPAAVLHPSAFHVHGCWPASPRVSLSGPLPDWGALYRFSIWQRCPGAARCW